MSLQSAIFGPSKKIIWQKVAQDIGGQYKGDGIWNGDALHYSEGPWEIVLDTYATSNFESSDDVNPQAYTRMRAPFLNKDNLQFEIYREGFFTIFSKWLGMQDIEIGDSYFDQNFVIKSNRTGQVKLLLDDSNLKKLIQTQPRIHFKIQKDGGLFGKRYPAGVDILYFETFGVIKDLRLLKNLFEMFTITLDRVVQIDSAYDRDPNVKL